MNLGLWDTVNFNFGSRDKKWVEERFFYAAFITLGGGGSCGEEASVKIIQLFSCVHDPCLFMNPASWKIYYAAVFMHPSPHVAVVQWLFPTKLMCVMTREQQWRHISTEFLHPERHRDWLLQWREKQRGGERERGVKLCHMTGDEGDALSSWEQRDLPLKHLISNCEFTQMQGMVIVFLIKQCWDVLVRFVKKLNKKLKEIEGKLQRKQVWGRLYRNIQHSSVGAICWLKFTSLQHPLQLHTHLK